MCDEVKRYLYQVAEQLLSKVFSSKFLAELRPNSSESHHYVHRLFIDTDEWSSEQRDSLELELGMAQRHRALTANLVSRLRSDDEFVFFGQLYELRVAHYFESRGANLRFYPRGRKGSSLEFEAGLKPRLLVEVKTPQRRPDESKKAKQARRLTALAQEVEGAASIAITVVREGRTRAHLPHTRCVPSDS